MAVFGRLLSLEDVDATVTIIAYSIPLSGTFLSTTWVAISLPLLTLPCPHV